MKVIAVIPARYDSSRFYGKLMQKLGEHSIIWTTYRNVQNTGLFEDVFVATDSEIIFDEITKKSGKAILTGKHETGSDRIAEAIKNVNCDVVINVQGDEPFLNKKPLNQLINVFKEDNKKEISLASLKIKFKSDENPQDPNHVKVITDVDGFALYFSRSLIPHYRDESTETEYFRHIGVYAFRREALLRFASLEQTPLESAEKIECIRYLEHGMKIKLIETDFIGIGIDTPEDLKKAREIIEKRR